MWNNEASPCVGQLVSFDDNSYICFAVRWMNLLTAFRWGQKLHVG